MKDIDGLENKELEQYVFGPKPVEEAVFNHPERVEVVFVEQEKVSRMNRIITGCKLGKLKFKIVDRQRLDAMFQGRHQGVAAKIFRSGFVDLEEVLVEAKKAPLPLLVALDQIQDPGNVGTLARTVLGVGAGGMILPKDRTASLGFSAAKASAGALSRILVARVINLSRALDECSDQGFTIYGAVSAQAGKNLYQVKFNKPMVLVLGNEEKGIREGVLRRCHEHITIPLKNQMESFNVAQAGAMILGECTRQMFFWT